MRLLPLITTASLLFCFTSPSLVMATPPEDGLWVELDRNRSSAQEDAPFRMNTFSVMAQALSPSVVNIGTKTQLPRSPIPFFFGPQEGSGLGTGFIINKDGYILTNFHVIEHAKEITVTLSNEEEYPAEVIGAFESLDVALLKISTEEPLTPAPLGNSSQMKIGDWVMAIGNPFGLSHTVTAGIVSAKGRHAIAPNRRANIARFIQTDASINPGNSGGPLLNIYGEVIGINTAINAAGQGIGFSVPIDMVKIILPQLANGKVKRSYMGVVIGPVPRELGKNKKGAYVVEVEGNGPAEQAGLKKGDTILELNKNPINHHEDLPWYTSISEPDLPIPVVIERDGNLYTLKIKLTTYPDPDELVQNSRPVEKAGKGARPFESLGLKTKALPPSERESLNSEEKPSLVITEVSPQGLAQRMGLKKGDLILRANGNEVSTAQELEQIFSSAKNGIQLEILRENTKIFTSFLW